MQLSAKEKTMWTKEQHLVFVLGLMAGGVFLMFVAHWFVGLIAIFLALGWWNGVMKDKDIK